VNGRRARARRRADRPANPVVEEARRQRDERPGQHKRKLSRLETNPAIVRGVTVALALLAAGGISWAADVPRETIELVAYVVGVLAPVVVGLWTRFAVTPNAKVVTRYSVTDGTVVAGDAAAFPTGEEVDTRATHVSGVPTIETFAVPLDPKLVDG
jgi:hypothetical protein